MEELGAAGVRVVAVSPDGEDVTARFCEAHGLNQTVLLDPDRAIAKAYGAARLGGWVPNRRVTVRVGRDKRVKAWVHAELGLGGHLSAAET